MVTCRLTCSHRSGASLFIAGNTELQPLINVGLPHFKMTTLLISVRMRQVGTQLVGSECSQESQKDFAVKQSYRLVTYNSDGEALGLEVLA